MNVEDLDNTKKTDKTSFEAVDALSRMASLSHYSYQERYHLCNIIQKELNALKIIKEKNVDCLWLKVYNNVDEYNKDICGLDKKRHLTQYEFDLLKEVLK